MTRKTPEEKIAELKATKAKINARMANERAKVRTQKRKNETRLKVIVGAIVLEHMTYDQDFYNTIATALSQHTTRATDREFLDKHLGAYLDDTHDKGKA